MKYLKSLAFGIIGTSLIACGGGSGGTESSTPPVSPPPTPVTKYSEQQILDAASSKYRAYTQEHSPAEGFPRALRANNLWEQKSLNWTSGFFPGVLWQLHVAKPNEAFDVVARQWSLPLLPYASYSTHDVGFVLNNSMGKGYRIKQDDVYLEGLKRAADNLVSRFDPKVGAIRSWDNENKFIVIIDNMMNLALLFEAAKWFSDDNYYQVALQHMQTAARNFVRDNGSSFHVVNFSQTTGAVTSRETHQGNADNSTWSRGQAWGIYGFSYAFKETGDALALQTAQKMADYWLSQTSVVPGWDFDVNDGIRDTSAAAIAASGLWQLSQILKEGDDGPYRRASISLIDNLLSSEYINLEPEHSALLLHATGHKPANSEVDTSLIYADYYLLEAVLLKTGLISVPL